MSDITGDAPIHGNITKCIMCKNKWFRTPGEPNVCRECRGIHHPMDEQIVKIIEDRE